MRCTPNFPNLRKRNEAAEVNIRKAEQTDLESVRTITQTTIKEVYPKYYPAGAVEFFSEHHSDEKIMRDIDAGIVYLLIADDGEPAGTVTLTGNEIDRLFVLPQYQGKGYGRALLDLAEDTIAKEYDVTKLHASLPAKNIYLKRGFSEVDYLKIDTGRGDYLCADVMEK